MVFHAATVRPAKRNRQRPNPTSTLSHHFFLVYPPFPRSSRACRNAVDVAKQAQKITGSPRRPICVVSKPKVKSVFCFPPSRRSREVVTYVLLPGIPARYRKPSGSRALLFLRSASPNSFLTAKADFFAAFTPTHRPCWPKAERQAAPASPSLCSDPSWKWKNH